MWGTHASLTFRMTWFVSHPDLNLPDFILFSATPAILGAVSQLRTPAFPLNEPLQCCRINIGSVQWGGVGVQAHSPTPQCKMLRIFMYSGTKVTFASSTMKKRGDKRPYVQRGVTAFKHNKGRRYRNRRIPMAVKS